MNLQAGVDILCKEGKIIRLQADVERLRKHYDAAGPEHNLLALLDLYHDRAKRLERALREVPHTCTYRSHVECAGCVAQQALRGEETPVDYKEYCKWKDGAP